MTQHPGYPAGYHSLIECRKLGICWYCQSRPALKREFCGNPCCSQCKKKYSVEVSE